MSRKLAVNYITHITIFCTKKCNCNVYRYYYDFHFCVIHAVKPFRIMTVTISDNTNVMRKFIINFNYYKTKISKRNLYSK